MIYSYKFNDSTDAKPFHTHIGERIPDGYVSFGGDPVDWRKFDYIDGSLVLIPVLPASDPEPEYVPTPE